MRELTRLCPQIQRTDDNAETLLKRLSTYHKQTGPVAEYYKKKGALAAMRGAGRADPATAQASGPASTPRKSPRPSGGPSTPSSPRRKRMPRKRRGRSAAVPSARAPCQCVCLYAELQAMARAVVVISEYERGRTVQGSANSGWQSMHGRECHQADTITLNHDARDYRAFYATSVNSKVKLDDGPLSIEVASAAGAAKRLIISF